MNSLSSETTHLITECDQDAEGDYFVSKRTIKILLAMSQGLSMISSDWIKQSIKNCKLLDERRFKAKGIKFNGKISYFDKEGNRGLLFTGKRFIIKHGANLMVTNQQLTQLIVNSGGEITDAPDSQTYVVLMNEKQNNGQMGPMTTSYLFIIDSVTANQIQDPTQYR